MKLSVIRVADVRPVLDLGLMRRYAGSSSCGDLGDRRPPARRGTATRARSARRRAARQVTVRRHRHALARRRHAHAATARRRMSTRGSSALQAPVVDASQRQRRLAMRAAVGGGDERAVGPRQTTSRWSSSVRQRSAGEIAGTGDRIPVAARAQDGSENTAMALTVGRSFRWSDHQSRCVPSHPMGVAQHADLRRLPLGRPRALGAVLQRGVRLGGRAAPGGCVPSRSCPAATSSSTTTGLADRQPAPRDLRHGQRPPAPRLRPASSPAPRADGRTHARVDPRQRRRRRGRDPRAGESAGRPDPVAPPLLEGVQRLQRRVPGSVGQHRGAVDQGWRRPHVPEGYTGE